MAAWPPHMDGSIVFARWRKSAPHLIHDSLGPFESIKKGIANGISIGSAVFARLTADGSYTLQWAAPFPSKLPLRIGGSGPHLIRDSLGAPESTTQNGILIGSAVIVALTIVSRDRPTDRQTTHAK